MAEAQLLTLDQLNLKMGQVIQIHPDPADSDKRYDCVLVGGLPGETVIITSPTSGRFPQLKEGDVIAIRVMSANGVAIFPSVVLFISEEPLYLVFLDFPKSIKFRMIRTASRVDVAMPVLLHNQTQPGKGTLAGKILDISLGGAQIEIEKDGGVKGDIIEIKGKFEVGNIKRITKIMAVIRMKKPLPDGKFRCGVEFDERDEEKLLVLFGYIFNAMAVGEAKIIQ